jgi:tetratricopeptide (TPR) repeat protein
MQYIYTTLLCLLLVVSGSSASPTIAELEAQVKEDPNDELVLYNLGLLLYLADEPQRAIEPWSRLMELAPDDWQVQIKLIQAYSASGEDHREKREQAIVELYGLRDSEEIPELSSTTFFIRDQFDFEDCRVYVFEYYDMEAEWRLGPLLWKFYVTIDNEPTGRLVSVGSYDLTTVMAVATGDIEEGERMYHLDEYLDGGAHRTYGFFTEKPDYDRIKASALQILEDKLEPISSFDPQTRTITVDTPEE